MHERSFFGDVGEDTMDAEGAKADLKLTNREYATLVLKKRTAYNRTIFDDRNQWKIATAALEEFYIDFSMKRKAFERIKDQQDGDAEEIESVRNPQRGSNTINIFDSDDEHDESVISSEDNSDMTSTEQLIIDRNEAIKEFKTVIRAWSSYIPDWKTLYPEKVFSHYEGNDGIMICDPDPFTELMTVDMGILM